MATNRDLTEAYVNSQMENPMLWAIQEQVFVYLLEHINIIGHWPTRATRPLFDILVQKHFLGEL